MDRLCRTNGRANNKINSWRIFCIVCTERGHRQFDFANFNGIATCTRKALKAGFMIESVRMRRDHATTPTNCTYNFSHISRWNQCKNLFVNSMKKGKKSPPTSINPVYDSIGTFSDITNGWNRLPTTDFKVDKHDLFLVEFKWYSRAIFGYTSKNCSAFWFGTFFLPYLLYVKSFVF